MDLNPTVFIVWSSILIGAKAAFPVEQVHISLGTNETEMIITWTLPEHQKIVPKGLVHYYPENMTTNEAMVSGACLQHFDDDETEYYTYRALLNVLNPNTTYYYWIELVSSATNAESSNSKVFQFKTFPAGPKWLPRLGVYGDLGYVNERSLPFLKQDVEQNKLDALFHIGDFAYDLPAENGWCGHKFMRTLEPVASKVPYMTCPGNHEEYNNFSHYDSRFSMLSKRNDPVPIDQRLNNHFHSMNIGPAHIIMFSTEYYYYTEYGWDQIRRQFEWLEEDLRLANQNRQERPWLIVMGHRPLYCLKMGDISCDHRTMERITIRRGIHFHRKYNSPRQYGLEDLFYKHGVDIQLYGHEHFYARMLPMYNYTIQSGDHSSNPYDNPKAPIHVTTGSAGNEEFHPPFNRMKEWVACHFLDYGYTRLLFENELHIRLEQVSDDQNGEVLDRIDIIKDSPFPQWMHKPILKDQFNDI